MKHLVLFYLPSKPQSKLPFLVYLKVVKLDPKNIEALQALGEISYESKQAQKSEKWFKQLLAQKPKDGRANYALGMIHYRAKKWTSAIGFLGQALASDRKNADAAYHLC